ncbi:hypothetical protein PG985_007491 [Apiospora marii]|uniref:uncharacterized protein n=1 Tax=Apiospora marii TaxID=335849 RepID=UPI00312CC73C
MDSASIFKTAQEAFRATLSAKDQARYVACDTPTELVESFQKLETLARQKQKSKLNGWLKVIEQLNTRLQVYFDALNVIAGAHDAAALVYGAIRIVLQLGATLPSFFDRLLSTINRLADTFPQYEAIVDVFDGKPSLRMQQHLEKVYQDLFEFLRAAAKVLTASSGRVKRPVEMIAIVIWKPFDHTFGGILTRMENHREFILEELEILQAQRLRDAERVSKLERDYAEKERLMAEEDRKRTQKIENLTKYTRRAQEKEIKDSSVRRIEEWLAAPLFAETLESSQEHRIENTARWIFKNDGFKEWASMRIDVDSFAKQKRMPPWVLWAHGNPGCGKTTVASSVYEELMKETNSLQPSNMICYFFFKHTDQKSSTIDAAYRSALTQILHRYHEEDEILDKFLFIQSNSNPSSRQSCATTKQLHDLMCMSAKTLGRIAFVVDGVDEADDPNGVVERLRDLVTTAPIRLICFSRSNVSRFHDLVPTQQRIVFSRDLTNPDIRAFLESEILDLVEEAKLPSTANINSLVEALLSGADGMFLWAKLMTRFIRSPALSRTARLGLINSVRMPEGLDAMYNRITSLIMDSCEPEQNLARNVLLWVRHPRPEGLRIGIDCLRTAVGYDLDADEKDGFKDAVISVCCGLIEFTNRRGFNLTHLTVIEYFEKNWSIEGGKEVVIPNIAMATPELTSRCVEKLVASAPSKLPLDRWSRNMYGSNEAMLSFRDSFEAYATAEWAYSLASIPHEKVWKLHESGGGTYGADISRLKGVTARFLGNLLAVGLWIENIYALRMSTHDIVQSITGITVGSTQELDIADQRLKTQLVDVAEDLLSVRNEWGSTLLKTPHLIWTDVILFTKLKILSKFDTSSLGTAYSLTPEDVKDGNGCSERPLCSISSTSSDARMTAVLSIFPSTPFAQFWDDSNRSIDTEERLCDGWIAKYDIWAQGSRSQLASLQIPLPREEISIIIRQSFRIRKGVSKPYNSEISFPLAIGPDCLTVTILRTVYRFSTDQSKSPTTCHSSLLPLECLSRYQIMWGEKLQPFGSWRADRVTWNDWYVYSLTFSPDGTIMCFADYKKSYQVNLALFKIHCAPTLRLQFIRLTKVLLSFPGVSELHLHPSRSLLAFLGEAKVAEPQVWLWDFGAICGSFILARNTTDTVVIPVPQEKPRDADAVQDKRASKRKRGADQLEPDSYPNSSLRLIGDQGLQGRTLPSAHLSMAGTTPSILTVVPEGNSISLELSTPGRPGEKMRRQLVTLPDAHDTGDKAISIKLPEIQDEPLQIVLNKSAETGYNLNNDQHVHRPTVIEKNIRLVESRLTITTSAVDQPPQKRVCLPPHLAAMATEASTTASNGEDSVPNIDATFGGPDQT